MTKNQFLAIWWQMCFWGYFICAQLITSKWLSGFFILCSIIAMFASGKYCTKALKEFDE